MNIRAWAEVNGVAIRYDYRAGQQATYVLLHEMGGSLESWDDVAGLLPGSSAILRYDQRGFGLSEKPVGKVTIDQHVDDLLGLLETLNVRGPIVIAGVAVGAGIAIRLAARYPERVSHLLAFAPACGVAAERQAGALEMAQEIAANGIRMQASALFEMAYPQVLRSNLQRYKQYRSAWLSTDARALGGIYQMLATQDLDSDIAALSVPTLLVGGLYDALRPEAEIRRIAALCPQAQCVFVPSGHFMQIHSPAFVSYMLLQFPDNPGQSQAVVQRFLEAPKNRVGHDGPVR